MDKEQIISFIKQQMDSGKITGSDLAVLAGQSAPVASAANPAVTAENSRKKNSWGIVNVLYMVGAVIVIAGVAILAYQHWNEIGFGGRIAITLGIALVSYIMGLFMGKDRAKSMTSQVMFIIATALAPIGIYVLLDQMGVAYTSSTQIFVALSLLIVFAAAQFAVRNNVLVIIMIAQGSWAYYALVDNLFGGAVYSTDWLQYSSLVLGLAYIFIGYGYGKSRAEKGGVIEQEESSIMNTLYGLGALAVLGSAISLGGMWDLLIILFIFGAFYGSVFLKSRSMMFLGAIFLVAHMIKLTSKYFVGSLSWPVALIFCGVVVMAVAYGTLKMNKKYFGHAGESAKI